MEDQYTDEHVTLPSKKLKPDTEVVKENEFNLWGIPGITTIQKKMLTLFLASIDRGSEEMNLAAGMKPLRCICFSLQDFKNFVGIHKNLTRKQYVDILDNLRTLGMVRSVRGPRISGLQGISIFPNGAVLEDNLTGRSMVVLESNYTMDKVFFQYQAKYFKYSLINGIRLNNAVQMALYEIIRQRINDKKTVFEIELNQLKINLGLSTDKYEVWQDFKSKVLEPAHKEINAKTDVIYEYEPMYGRRKKVVGVRFYDCSVQEYESVDPKENEKVLTIYRFSSYDECRKYLEGGSVIESDILRLDESDIGPMIGDTEEEEKKQSPVQRYLEAQERAQKAGKEYYDSLPAEQKQLADTYEERARQQHKEKEDRIVREIAISLAGTGLRVTESQMEVLFRKLWRIYNKYFLRLETDDSPYAGVRAAAFVFKDELGRIDNATEVVKNRYRYLVSIMDRDYASMARDLLDQAEQEALQMTLY